MYVSARMLPHTTRYMCGDSGHLEVAIAFIISDLKTML